MLNALLLELGVVGKYRQVLHYQVLHLIQSNIELSYNQVRSSFSYLFCEVFHKDKRFIALSADLLRCVVQNEHVFTLVLHNLVVSTSHNFNDVEVLSRFSLRLEIWFQRLAFKRIDKSYDLVYCNL